MKKKINKNFGILFFITGLSGSGKTSLTNRIKSKIRKLYGPTFIFSGEKIRSVLKYSGYSKRERTEIGKKNIDLINLILKQKINVIYDGIALIEILRKIKRKKIKNYLEIFIKTEVDDIVKFNKKKKIYKKVKKNIVGIHIKPDFPKNPDIKIKNNFIKSLDILSEELLKKIKKIVII